MQALAEVFAKTDPEAHLYCLLLWGSLKRSEQVAGIRFENMRWHTDYLEISYSKSKSNPFGEVNESVYLYDNPTGSPSLSILWAFSAYLQSVGDLSTRGGFLFSASGKGAQHTFATRLTEALKLPKLVHVVEQGEIGRAHV